MQKTRIICTIVSKNASKTEPAKLLVFLLSQESESLVVRMKSPGSELKDGLKARQSSSSATG